MIVAPWSGTSEGTYRQIPSQQLSPCVQSVHAPGGGWGAPSGAARSARRSGR